MYSNTGFDASSFVSSFNKAFYFVTVISLILLAGLTIMMILFVVRYNAKKNKPAIQITGSNKLEILWTVIPTLLALAMFHYGWSGWKPLNKPPRDAMNVTSTARMWSFTFTYENGRQTADLIIPVNKPVKIDLVSTDVVHSLFIPEFRLKSDMVPGIEKKMWFLPEKVGDYIIYCAEYCGLRHSYMSSRVRVLSQEDFNAWYADTLAVVPGEEGPVTGAAGLDIMSVQGCQACHSTDGSKIIGPSYLKLYGETQRVIRDGKEITVTVDDDYIRRAIYEPDYEVVVGYQRSLMQSYKGTLNEEDILKIIEYIKALNE